MAVNIMEWDMLVPFRGIWQMDPKEKMCMSMALKIK
jgi:hypothetical protein